jgi:hypothetical protein
MAAAFNRRDSEGFPHRAHQSVPAGSRATIEPPHVLHLSDSTRDSMLKARGADFIPISWYRIPQGNAKTACESAGTAAISVKQ